MRVPKAAPKRSPASRRDVPPSLLSSPKSVVATAPTACRGWALSCRASAARRSIAGFVPSFYTNLRNSASQSQTQTVNRAGKADLLPTKSTGPLTSQSIRDWWSRRTTRGTQQPQQQDYSSLLLAKQPLGPPQRFSKAVPSKQSTVASYNKGQVVPSSATPKSTTDSGRPSFITPEGYRLIQKEEIGSRKRYKPYPVVPPVGVSGATIGIGYDLGKNLLEY
jgi:hypothetical protein